MNKQLKGDTHFSISITKWREHFEYSPNYYEWKF